MLKIIFRVREHFSYNLLCVRVSKSSFLTCFFLLKHNMPKPSQLNPSLSLPLPFILNWHFWRILCFFFSVHSFIKQNLYYDYYIYWNCSHQSSQTLHTSRMCSLWLISLLCSRFSLLDLHWSPLLLWLLWCHPSCPVCLMLLHAVLTLSACQHLPSCANLFHAGSDPGPKHLTSSVGGILHCLNFPWCLCAKASHHLSPWSFPWRSWKHRVSHYILDMSNSTYQKWNTHWWLER